MSRSGWIYDTDPRLAKQLVIDHCYIVGSALESWGAAITRAPYGKIEIPNTHLLTEHYIVALRPQSWEGASVISWRKTTCRYAVSSARQPAVSNKSVARLISTVVIARQSAAAFRVVAASRLGAMHTAKLVASIRVASADAASVLRTDIRWLRMSWRGPGSLLISLRAAEQQTDWCQAKQKHAHHMDYSTNILKSRECTQNIAYTQAPQGRVKWSHFLLVRMFWLTDNLQLDSLLT